MMMVMGILVAAGAIFLSLRPLWRVAPGACAPGDPSASERARLESHKTRLYASIRDLDFDRATGKLSEADHEELRASLVRQAAAVVRELEARQDSDELDDAIEARVASRVAVAARLEREPPASACPACGARLRGGLKFCSQCGREAGASACSSCGHGLLPGDKFCGQCGHQRAAV
jgi:hypothetical protein